MQKVVLLKSGHKLTFNTAPFEDAFELVQRISDAFDKVGIRLSADLIEAVAAGDNSKVKIALLSQDADFFFGALRALLSSRALKDQVLLCLQHCTLDSCGAPEKADAAIFQKDKARPDFLSAAWEVIRLNGGPFFEGLLSGSSNRGGSTSQTQV